MVPLISKSFKIVTTCAVTTVTDLIQSETVTVELQALCFFAVAEDLLVWVYLFSYGS